MYTGSTYLIIDYGDIIPNRSYKNMRIFQ